MMIDAVHFVPQSRPRVFIVAVHPTVELSQQLVSQTPLTPWHPERMVTAFNGLSAKAQELWLWWNLPLPDKRLITFTDIIDEEPVGVKWDSPEKTKLLLSMMTEAISVKLKLL